MAVDRFEENPVRPHPCWNCVNLEVRNMNILSIKAGDFSNGIKK